ncbi:hypothetical protein [Leifsonia sp. Leaf264]|uniref:hypothetical protein n=1 Tax=Leifsonia sp. Leaf264 TaxID=1736314 RepID=UPI0006F8B89F|nr:hypothetical protein [Leifsonia sp. Leaf264]KQO98211.1 hypothetical protein ASF30_09120 [Leifsonia sp. Leaf264]
MSDPTIAVTEKTRTYVYDDGPAVYRNVVEVTERAGGFHTVKTADGREHAVTPGWLWAEPVPV